MGITKTWSVVLVGDNVQLPPQSGSSPTTIVDDHPSSRRTLFQDIFGKSSLSDISDNSQNTNVSDVRHGRIGNLDAVGILDGPAYLTSSLDELFDPLISKFLKQRTNPDVEVADEIVEPDHGGENEDDYMEDDSEKHQIVDVTRITKPVDQEDMSIFVNLFRKHIGICKLTFHFCLMMIAHFNS